MMATAVRARAAHWLRKALVTPTITWTAISLTVVIPLLADLMLPDLGQAVHYAWAIPPTILAARRGLKAGFGTGVLALVGTAAWHGIGPPLAADVVDVDVFWTGASVMMVVVPSVIGAYFEGISDRDKLLTDVYEGFDFGVLVALRTGVVFSNGAWAALTGMPASPRTLEEAAGHPAVLDLDLSDPSSEAFSGETINGTVHSPRPNGEDRVLARRVTPVTGRAGRLIGVTITLRDVTSSWSEFHRWREAAFSDKLTGLANVRFLEEVCRKEMALLRENGGTYAAVMIDADGFKVINDTLGHHAGDEALGLVANLIRSNCRVQDYAIRRGGDEFLVLLPHTDEAGALGMARRIVDAAANTRLPGHGRSSLSVSVGVAVYTGKGEDLDETVKAADRALYQAKSQGGGQAVSYSEVALRA